MTEYIERDMLCRVLERYRKAPKNRYQRGVEDGMELALNAIKAIHAADVAPVAHGRWEWFDEETGTPFTGNVPIAGKNCLTITMTLIIDLRFDSVTAAARRWTEV